MSVLTEPPDVSGLAADLSGPVFLPYDAGYAEEIAGFNTAVVHRPAVVVGAATDADVATALRYAAGGAKSSSSRPSGSRTTNPEP